MSRNRKRRNKNKHTKPVRTVNTEETLPIPPRVMDYGTPELWKRCEMVKEKVDEHTVRARNLSNTWPIDRYHKRGTVNDFQHRAASRIYRDFTIGKVTSFTGSNWPDPANLPHNRGNYRGLELSERQAEALSAFREAYASLNHESSFIVWHVVCIGVEIGLYEQAADWKRGYGMTRLREALDDLVHFYQQKKREVKQ